MNYDFEEDYFEGQCQACLFVTTIRNYPEPDVDLCDQCESEGKAML